jgi:hypothetical protein
MGKGERIMQDEKMRISMTGQLIGLFIFWLSLPVIYGILFILADIVAPALLPGGVTPRVTLAGLLGTLAATPFVKPLYWIIPAIAGFVSWKIAHTVCRRFQRPV